jgi:cell division protein FtsW
MSKYFKKINARVFLGLTSLIMLVGFFIFASASMGRLDNSFQAFIQLTGKQLAVLLAGFSAMLLLGNIYYKKTKPFAWPLLVATVFLTALIFVPGLGIKSGGAYRWLNLGIISIQPSEFLKLGLVMTFAWWCSEIKDKVTTMRFGLLPYLGLVGLSGALLLAQPDAGTFLVSALALSAMFFVAGANAKQMLLVGLIGLVGISGLLVAKPYLQARVMTFISPNQDTRGSSYQLHQSLLAIGSGGLNGRGFGQSLQKFNFLPQPIGDSIFAVAAEEFGFIGSTVLVALFLFFGLWGLRIASRAPDSYSRLLSVGLVILILSQSFMNILAMIGLIPLTGDPLIFVSQGGTSLLFASISAGLLLNIAKHTN